MAHDVTLITGDGVGPELAVAARRCVDATGVKIQWDMQEAGVEVMQRTGTPLPEATIVLPGQDSNRATSTGVTPGSTSSTAPGASPETTTGGTTPGTTTAASPSVPQTPFVSAAAGAAPVSSVPGTIIREWNTNPPVSGEPPLFANPQAGALYLQMGAVDKGIAVVLAEGLRRHGFNSLVAPGPSEKIFRVLIGPFATQEDFKRAKAEVDAIDLGTFARRFQK